MNSLQRSVLAWAPFLIIAALGIFLRLESFEPLHGVGFDEQIYATYVGEVTKKGVTSYPEIIGLYIKDQAAYPIALLPPTRITFILAASFWQAIFGGPIVEAIRAVSCTASILLLFLSSAIAWRMRGRSFALAVLVLMAVAPTQIYIAHRALIDGFFALIATATIGALWEALQQPRRRWIILYAAGIVLLVLTKENAAFVYAAIVGLLIANRWLRFGEAGRMLIMATLAAPIIGALIGALFAGGFEPLISVFSINAAKTLVTPYAIATGDGPWFRYLSDLLLVSPAVTLFAIGGAFSLARADKAGWFLLGFLLFTYLPMCNVTYGMNLRYGNIWDFPLRFLALVPVYRWAFPVEGARRPWLAITLVALLAIFELGNYLRVFVASPVYDPIPSALMKALDMIKPLPSQ